MPKKNESAKKPHNRSRRVTHTDIAKELGVSQMTVSLSLRNHPRISEATRIRVQEKAAEMNYQPDPMLSALANYRLSNQEKATNSALAWINPFKDPSVLRAQKEFNLYWKGAVYAAERLGFHLDEFTTSELTLKRMDTIFKTRNIQGIIIASLGGTNLTGGWENFPWKDYTAVRFGLSTTYPEVHHITSSQVRNSIKAFNKIKEKGYQRIGFYGHRSPTRLFSAGVSFAQDELPEHQRIPALFVEKYAPEQQQIAALKDWLHTNKPDAILTDRPDLYQTLTTIGYSVPGDIGLATLSIHDTHIDAGINQNPEEIGRAAVRTLVALLNEQSVGIPAIENEILIEGKWVEGSMLPSRR